jgi:phosphohistidine phosphatase SixA
VPIALSRRVFLLTACAAPFARAEDDAIAWKRLREGGHVILVRHASTVAGVGDPPNFKIGDCSTQRNLSEAGREESRRLGARLREERVPIGAVYTSPWCRCRETAMLAFGRAEDWEPLASFFDYPHREAADTESVKKRIAGYSRRPHGPNVVMVTHNVNVAALTKLSIAQAEMVVVRPDGCCGLKVVGRLRV